MVITAVIVIFILIMITLAILNVHQRKTVMTGMWRIRSRKSVSGNGRSARRERAPDIPIPELCKR